MRQVRGTDHESGLHIICLSCCWNTGVEISRSPLDIEVWSSGEKSSLDIKVLEADLSGGARGNLSVHGHMDILEAEKEKRAKKELGQQRAELEEPGGGIRDGQTGRSFFQDGRGLTKPW